MVVFAAIAYANPAPEANPDPNPEPVAARHGKEGRETSQNIQEEIFSAYSKKDYYRKMHTRLN